MKGRIIINDIRLYAFHGCMEEEAAIGGQYIIDLEIETDFAKAIATDNLIDTVDYCHVFSIVKREMMVRSNLIEHAANRIGEALKKEIRKITKLQVKLTKIAPPVNGEMRSVSVIVEL